MREKASESRIVVVLLLMMVSFSVSGQAINDRIEHRIALTLDDPFLQSSTAKDQVQWNCISKKLTSACVTYHNDQWFTLAAPSTRTFFLNIRNQRCRRKWGIQIIVLEGDPCVTESYKLVTCIGYTAQSDIYVPLALDSGKSYLLNIDGFRGDECGFEISFASRAYGLPAVPVNQEQIQLEPVVNDSIVTLRWSLEDSLASRYSRLRVYQQQNNDKVSTLKTELSVLRNAYGKTGLDYQYTDTLHAGGYYHYFIYGNETDGTSTLLNATVIRFAPRVKHPYYRYDGTLNIQAAHSESVQLQFYNDATQELLFREMKQLVAGSNRFHFDLTTLYEKGVRTILVVVLGNELRQEHYINPVRVLAGYK